jgi:4'-phosphopantetheinyl transferase
VVIAELFSTGGSELTRGTVHVWRFSCFQLVGARAAVLSEAERVAARRFVSPVHRDAYYVQHTMMRLLLARYAGIAPADLVFAPGPHGKPALVGAGDLEFNLSHTYGVALLAVARDIAVGIDVERLDARIEQRELGRIVLAPDEVAASRAEFLRIWCRKEAALKATGVGLVDDLTAVSVAGDRADVQGTTIFVQDLVIGADYAAALATSVELPMMAPAIISTLQL